MGTEGTRYIEVPSDKLMGLLKDIGSKVMAKGGALVEGVQGREVVVDLTPAGSRTGFWFCTLVVRGSVSVRGCGEDAVRLLIGYTGEGRDGKFRFFPLSDGRRIYRTAPTKLPTDERVTVFLGRFQDALRETYAEARAWTACPSCGAPMSLRTNKATQSKFWGCTSFPDCRGTRPHAA